jgi:2-amino-4-hydroxy-6-hydroxymethyldihydropteridine diphosphokinase
MRTGLQPSQIVLWKSIARSSSRQFSLQPIHKLANLRQVQINSRSRAKRGQLASSLTCYSRTSMTSAIALGANLPSPAGSPEDTLAATLARLAALGRITACSSLYSTAPVGLADQPRFLNAVLTLETSLTPFELLGSLLALEQEFGRDRLNAIAEGPRTLDLDLILYSDFVLSESCLEVPHPRFAQRAFVLIPLNEIAPHLRDPRSGRTVSELFVALRSADPASRLAVHDTDAVVKIDSDRWRAAVAGALDASRTSDAARPSASPDLDHD